MDPWTQQKCAEACTKDTGCTAFVYGYEAYEAGGKDANVSKTCSDAPPACLFSNPDPLCHVPRCYLRSVEALTCGALPCTSFPGGGHQACTMKTTDGVLINHGEFSVYYKPHRAQ